MHATHETNIGADHRILGCVVRMDSRWHGFLYLCVGLNSSTFGAATQIWYSQDTWRVDLAGSILFALFLVGGDSVYLGPVGPLWTDTRFGGHCFGLRGVHGSRRIGRERVIKLFRLLAGIIGGEWALARTYVAEAWPEPRK